MGRNINLSVINGGMGDEQGHRDQEKNHSGSLMNKCKKWQNHFEHSLAFIQICPASSFCLWHSSWKLEKPHCTQSLCNLWQASAIGQTVADPHFKKKGRKKMVFLNAQLPSQSKLGWGGRLHRKVTKSWSKSVAHKQYLEYEENQNSAFKGIFVRAFFLNILSHSKTGPTGCNHSRWHKPGSRVALHKR